MIGLFSNSIPLIAHSLYTFIIAYMWSFGEVHHPRSVLCWFFIIYGSFKKEVRMPIPWMLILDYKNLKIIYGNIVAKCDINDCSFKRLLFLWLMEDILSGGVEWLNGYTLQYYIVSKGENFLTKFIIGKSWLLITLSYFSIILEILFPLAVFFKKIFKMVLNCGFLFSSWELLFHERRKWNFHYMALDCDWLFIFVR